MFASGTFFAYVCLKIIELGEVFYSETPPPLSGKGGRTNIMENTKSGRCVVLVVESEPYIRNHVCSHLLENGYSVIFADTVFQATRMLAGVLPGIILADTHLMGGSGIDFCHMVKNDERYQRAPVFLLSDRMDLQLKLKCYLAGAQKFICKPVDPDELMEQINFFMGKDKNRSDIRKEDFAFA